MTYLIKAMTPCSLGSFILVYAAVVSTQPSPKNTAVSTQPSRKKLCLESPQRALDCSRGTLNCETERCECEAGFTGPTCSVRLQNGTASARNQTAEELRRKSGRRTTTLQPTSAEPPVTPSFSFDTKGKKLCVNGKRVVKLLDKGFDNEWSGSADDYGETGASCDCSRERCANWTLDDPCVPNPCFPGTCFRRYHIRPNPLFIMDVTQGCSCVFEEKLQRSLNRTRYKLCHVCSKGTWGSNGCRNMCGMCDGPCHPTDGCSACLSGWEAPPKCIRAASCDDPAITPNCHAGVCTFSQLYNTHFCHCHDNYAGFDCSVWSPVFYDPDTYGSLGFSDCDDDTACENSGGRCVRMQPENLYQMRDPNTAEDAFERKDTCFCPPRKYFDGLACRDGCKTSTATCMFGQCFRDGEGWQCICSPGYEGGNCSISCSVGVKGRYRRNPRYGEQCQRECGRCFQLPCNPVNGSCGPFGCYPGWKGDNCRTPDLDQDENWSKAVVSVGLTLGGTWLEELRDKRSLAYRSFGRWLNNLNKHAIRRANLEFSEQHLEWRSQINFITQGSIVVDYFVFFEESDLTNMDNLDSKFGASLKTSGNVFKGTKYRLLPGSVKVRTVYRPPPRDGKKADGNLDDSRRETQRTLTVISVGILAACILVSTGVFIAWKARHNKHTEAYPTKTRMRKLISRVAR